MLSCRDLAVSRFYFGVWANGIRVGRRELMIALGGAAVAAHYARATADDTCDRIPEQQMSLRTPGICSRRSTTA